MSFGLVLLTGYLILISTFFFDGVFKRVKISKRKTLLAGLVVLVLYFMTQVRITETLIVGPGITFMLLVAFIASVKAYRSRSLFLLLYAFANGFFIFVIGNLIPGNTAEYVYYVQGIVIGFISAFTIKTPTMKTAHAVLTAGFICIGEYIRELVFSGYAILYIGRETFDTAVTAFVTAFLLSDIMYHIRAASKAKKETHLKNMAIDDMKHNRTQS